MSEKFDKTAVAGEVENKSIWKKLQALFFQFRWAKVAVIAVIAIFYGVYYFKTADTTLIRESKSGWDSIFHADRFKELEKYKQVNPHVTKVLSKAAHIGSFDNENSSDLSYVRQNSYEVLPLYESIDTSNLRLKVRIAYHTNMSQLSILLALLEEDVSHLLKADANILLANKLLISPSNTKNDFAYYTENKVNTLIKKTEFIISAVRQYYQPSETNEVKMKQKLSIFGGCNALIKKDIKLKVVFQATQCPVP